MIMDRVQRGFTEIYCSVQIKCLKDILLIESFLGVYRSVGFCSPIGKTIVFLLTLADFIGLITCVIGVVLYSVGPKDLLISTPIYSTISMSLSFFYSNRFAELVTILHIYDTKYCNDKVYARNLKKVNIITVSSAVIIFVRRTLIFIAIGINSSYRLTEFHSDYEVTPPFLLLIRVYYTKMNSLYMVGFCVTFCIMMVISEQLKCITRSVDKQCPSNNIEFLIYLKKCGLHFQNILKCVQLVRTIFGLQFVIILAMSFYYYIKVLSLLAKRPYEGLLPKVVWVLNLGILAFILVGIGMMLYGAQNLQKNADGLRRSLARLVNKNVSNGRVYKSSKDLVRLVGTCDVHVRAPGVQLGMALLPACIMLFTSSTIIYLQFNNII